jgi:cell wall-associated NlpC family hydrolase
MDCSGFIYYVLKQNGFPDVPRDSSGQYIWVRKAKNLYAVLSRKEDSFEFDDLKPGDLLFWRGTYNIDRDPPITHTMIYLGREKRTNKRVMVGSSDGRTYDGKQRWGVSVFDFKCRHRLKAAMQKSVRSLSAMAEFPACQRSEPTDRPSFRQQSERASVLLLMPAQRESDERGADIRPNAIVIRISITISTTRCSFVESSKIRNRRFIQ